MLPPAFAKRWRMWPIRPNPGLPNLPREGLREGQIVFLRQFLILPIYT